MGKKIGETPILRGSPPVLRTLEVLIDDDWILSEKLEKCVSFRETSERSGKVSVIFSRSITAEEARIFASLLIDAANVLAESAENPDSEP